MSADLMRLVGARFVRSFDGLEPPASLLDAIAAGRLSGVTLFRSMNVGSPASLADLCGALQEARPAGDPPLIVATDQEGGQLQAIGEGATAWPGNLALGAAGSVELARRCGRAIGREIAAAGITLNYAPVCDLLAPESATHLGTRPFGDDPAAVAALAAAFTEGLREPGVAAVLKHFPGAGRAAGDPHLAMPVLRQDGAELRARDLAPFRAGIAAGADVVMPGHLGVAAVGDAAVPATFSPAVLRDLLRAELGFRGVCVSDAMNMGGAAGAGSLGEAVVAAAKAGIDLLLLLNGDEQEEAAFAALEAAAAAGRIQSAALEESHERIMAMRRRFDAIERPGLDVLGCAEHRDLAREIAAASVTLVRDPGVLPLRPDAGRVAVVVPVPADLTPAETSSYLRADLAAALRERGFAVDEFVMPRDPTVPEAAALAHAVAGHAVRIVATFDAVAFPGQAGLLRRVAASPGGRTVGVALRTPYDAALVPENAAAVCTYGVQPPQIEALADALSGRIPFTGRLPVRLPVAAERVR